MSSSVDLIGRRIIVKSTNEKGTIKWFGKLPNHNDDRIGIEFDKIDVKRRHDGSFDGIEYFTTNYPNTGGFIKLKNVSFGKNLEECLEDKYKKIIKYENSWMIGEDKVQEKQAEIDKLEFIGLEGSELSNIGNLKINDINRMLNKVVELNLKNTLLRDWNEIDILIEALPNLKYLSIAGNRFNIFPNQNDKRRNRNGDGEYPKLNSLDISGTLIPWKKVINNCLVGLNNLKLVNLSDNNYDSSIEGSIPIDGLKCVILMDNKFNNLNKIIQLLPSTVEEVTLCGNQLGENGINESLSIYGNIKRISISRNNIKEWRWFGKLSKSMMELKSLRVIDNPIYNEYVTICSNKDDEVISNAFIGSSVDRSRQLLISLFPNLNELNGSSINDKQRIAAERYILHRYVTCEDKSIISVNDSSNGELIEKLKIKHSYIKEEKMINSQIKGGNIIKGNLRKLKIFPLDGRQPIIIRVSSNMKIADLRLLVYKRTRWPLDLDNLALQFDVNDDGLSGFSTDYLITRVDDFRDISYIIGNDDDDDDTFNDITIRAIVWDENELSNKII